MSIERQIEDEKGTMMISWVFLLCAAACEMTFVFEMKLSNGFTHWKHSVATVVFMTLSVVFLAVAAKRIPVATAYAIWTGLGVVGTIALEWLFLHEPVSLVRLICIFLILAGVAGLKLF